MRVKSTRVDSLVEDAVYKILSFEEVLDDIYELRDKGVKVSPELLTELELLIENCAVHEAFADENTFEK